MTTITAAHVRALRQQQVYAYTQIDRALDGGSRRGFHVWVGRLGYVSRQLGDLLTDMASETSDLSTAQTPDGLPHNRA